MGTLVLLLLLGAELEAPARLESQGKPIDVFGGHAAASVADVDGEWVVDWNGDGRVDLLVGDFHDHRAPGQHGNEHMHGWVWLYARR